MPTVLLVVLSHLILKTRSSVVVLLLLLFYLYYRDKINVFIDDNKALIRRMFGEFHVITDDDDDSPTSIPLDTSAEYNLSASASVRVERATRPLTPPSNSTRYEFNLFIFC